MCNKCQYSLNNNMIFIYNAIIITKRLHVELHNSLVLHLNIKMLYSAVLHITSIIKYVAKNSEQHLLR